MKHGHAIVVMARWETDSLLEWVAYHKSIGFDHVYVYCNDDDPSELFDRLCPYLAQPAPFVTFVHYPFQGLQWDIYMHWLRHHASDAEWVAFLDADEFLVLPGTDDVGRFTAAYPPLCDVIYVHWIYYGTSGFIQRPPGSVLRQYTRREASISFETKLLVRPHRIDAEALRPGQTKFFHLWDETHRQSLTCYTCLGDRLDSHYDRARFATERADDIRRTAFIAHFAIKAEEDMQRRKRRGLGGSFGRQRIWAEAQADGTAGNYIENTNCEIDFYLRDYWARIAGTPAATRLIASAPGPNLALHRPATQSSVSVWSLHPTAERDAAGAVSGVVTGRPSFHTDAQDGPWWQVDLGETESIGEIRLYNRADDRSVAARANQLVLLRSDDSDTWQEVYRRIADIPFGGADGNPLIVRTPGPVLLRYLRVMLLGRTYLALDQVELYAGEAAAV